MRTLSLLLAVVLALLAPTHALVATSTTSHPLATRAHHETTKTTETTSPTHAACGSDAECAAWDQAQGWASEGTPGGPRVRLAMDEDDPRWACHLDGNRRCSSTPLSHR